MAKNADFKVGLVNKLFCAWPDLNEIQTPLSPGCPRLAHQVSSKSKTRGRTDGHSVFIYGILASSGPTGLLWLAPAEGRSTIWALHQQPSVGLFCLCSTNPCRHFHHSAPTTPPPASRIMRHSANSPLLPLPPRLPHPTHHQPSQIHPPPPSPYPSTPGLFYLFRPWRAAFGLSEVICRD